MDGEPVTTGLTIARLAERAVYRRTACWSSCALHCGCFFRRAVEVIRVIKNARASV